MTGLRKLLLALGLCVGVACTTPTIPIPPPNPQDFSFRLDMQAGTATFEATVSREDFMNARVYVENDTQGVGVIVTANPDGTVSETPPFPGVLGDRIVVTYRIGDDSVAACVLLVEGRPGPNDVCP